MSAFALLFPTQSLLLIGGFPLGDAERLVPLVDAYFAGMHGLNKERQVAANRELVAYCAELLAAHRRGDIGGGDQDFIGYLLEDRTFGRPLTEDEVRELCKVLLIAGLHTTKGELGFLFHRVATDPVLQQQLRDDPSLASAPVEECLRVFGIITCVGRKVTKDVIVAGCPLKKGQMISMAPAAAGRDPARFSQPADFDLHRDGNTHIGFGVGPHRCLGLHLARQEMTVALQEWLARDRSSRWPQILDP